MKEIIKKERKIKKKKKNEKVKAHRMFFMDQTNLILSFTLKKGK